MDAAGTLPRLCELSAVAFSIAPALHAFPFICDLELHSHSPRSAPVLTPASGAAAGADFAGN